MKGMINMKINFLGTCAGTEPMPDRRHMSFCIETGGRIYWFDAGEGCSRTAHLMGIDLLSVSKVVISHTHMDHVGGLGNLFWYIRKLGIMRESKPQFGDIDLYIPNMETWDGIWKILRNTEEGFVSPFDINAHTVCDGLLFDDGIMRVTAMHNHHLPEHDFEPWLSYSYKIEAEGKTIVYSGDVGAYSDLDTLIGDGCDAVIIETGHFNIDKAHAYTVDKSIPLVCFSHNGREIINNPEESKKKVEDKFAGGGIICDDATSIII